MRFSIADSVAVTRDPLNAKFGEIGYLKDSSTCSRPFGWSAMTPLSAIPANDMLHVDSSCDSSCDGAYRELSETKTELYDR